MCKSFIKSFLWNYHIWCNLQRSICTNNLHKFVPLLFHESVIKLFLRKLVQCSSLCKCFYEQFTQIQSALVSCAHLWNLIRTKSYKSVIKPITFNATIYKRSLLETIYRNSLRLYFGNPFMKPKQNKFSKSTNCMQLFKFLWAIYSNLCCLCFMNEECIFKWTNINC